MCHRILFCAIRGVFGPTPIEYIHIYETYYNMVLMNYFGIHRGGRMHAPGSLGWVGGVWTWGMRAEGGAWRIFQTERRGSP